VIYNIVSIVLDVQYGVYVEISGFWQPEKSGVLTRSVINLARVQETRRAYQSLWKGQVRTRYNCLWMRTTQGPLWLSCLIQTSLQEMEWHVYVRTLENSQRGDVQTFSTVLSLSPYSEVYGRDPARPKTQFADQIINCKATTIRKRNYWISM
jgi:hypothetical protein